MYIRKRVEIYDTTLRDGAQQQGVNFSVADKLKIFEMLSDFGVDFIEGGWPGAIPKDTELFEKLLSSAALASSAKAKISAFGATRKPNTAAEADEQLRALVDSGAGAVCIVAKADRRHVEKALRTSPEENLLMIKESVEFLLAQGREAIVDAEHFFDGYAFDPAYSSEVVKTAFRAGAKRVVLCDTNGGALPSSVKRVVGEIVELAGSDQCAQIGIATGDTVSEHTNPELAQIGIATGDTAPLSSDPAGDAEPAQRIVGIHAHNDTGCAVANTLAAVEAGARHVQGTVNEYGERTGNANLLTVIANLELKMGIKCVPDLSKAYALAHNISEIANVNINQRQPFVGDIAFAHKAGLHASAIKIDPNLYQHIDPQLVGNDLKMIISEMAGRSSIELKAGELGFSEISSEILQDLTNRVKDLERQGYAFDSADASFELLLRESLQKKPRFFKVESWRIISERQGPRGTSAVSEATVKLEAGGKRVIQTGEGNGPVNALDAALRAALEDIYPQIRDFELNDYRVRLLDTSHGTDSVTRVLITCYDSERNRNWTTIGVGGNIVEASWEALTDCYIYGLIYKGAQPNA